jgi:hypothetical protein
LRSTATSSSDAQHPGGLPVFMRSAARRLRTYTLPSTGVLIPRSSRYFFNSTNLVASQPTCVIAMSAPAAIFFSSFRYW